MAIEQEKNNSTNTSFKSILNNDDELYKISKIEFDEEELSKTLQMTQAWLKQYK